MTAPITPIIRVLDKGPLHIRGAVELIDAAGNRFETGEQFTLCRCGMSGQAPFCDGSHRMGGFSNCARAAQPANA